MRRKHSRNKRKLKVEDIGEFVAYRRWKEMLPFKNEEGLTPQWYNVLTEEMCAKLNNLVEFFPNKRNDVVILLINRVAKRYGYRSRFTIGNIPQEELDAWDRRIYLAIKWDPERPHGTQWTGEAIQAIMDCAKSLKSRTKARKKTIPKRIDSFFIDLKDPIDDITFDEFIAPPEDIKYYPFEDEEDNAADDDK